MVATLDGKMTAQDDIDRLGVLFFVFGNVFSRSSQANLVGLLSDTSSLRGRARKKTLVTTASHGQLDERIKRKKLKHPKSVTMTIESHLTVAIRRSL